MKKPTYNELEIRGKETELHYQKLTCELQESEIDKGSTFSLILLIVQTDNSVAKDSSGAQPIS